MNLSTSSSSQSDASVSIIRAVFTCFGILAFYAALVSLGCVPASDGIGQEENNLIRAQSYAFNNAGAPTMVLVGTSLTSNLKASYFDANVVNLGIAGGSARTGLALVAHVPRKPQVVLIEVDDKITIPLDQKLLASATGSEAALASRVPILREEYRPVSVMVSALKTWMKRRRKATDESDTIPVPPQVRQQLIAQTLAGQMTPLSAEQHQALQSSVQQIQTNIALLKRDGVRVVLFNPPGEPIIQSSLQQIQVRALLHSLFPMTEYEWLPDPPTQIWTTGDGIHLIRADAIRYATFMRQQLVLARPAQAGH